MLHVFLFWALGPPTHPACACTRAPTHPTYMTTSSDDNQLTDLPQRQQTTSDLISILLGALAMRFEHLREQ